jgi:hypothetical protein
VRGEIWKGQGKAKRIDRKRDREKNKIAKGTGIVDSSQLSGES